MGARAAAKKRRDFHPHAFLATLGEGRKIVHFAKKETIFTQGDPTDAVFYIQTGKVRLTVVSKIGKEATIGILGEGEFFGEGGLAGQPLRMGSANRNDGLRASANWQEGNDACAPAGTHVLGSVCSVSTGTEHPIRGGFG